MRITLALAASFAVMLLTLVGCGGGSGGGLLPTQEYFPLVQGNQWRYRVVDYTVDSAALSKIGPRPRHLRGGSPAPLSSVMTTQDGDVPGISVLTVYLSGLKPIAGTNWFEAVTVQAGLDTEMVYYRHDQNGLLVRASAEDDPYYLIRSPLKVGQSWTVPFAADCRFTIVAFNETVETPAGSFTDCLQIEETGIWESIPYRTVSWFAPAVGLVSTVDYYDGEMAVGAELLDLDLH
jgi:hypothetical protein